MGLFRCDGDVRMGGVRNGVVSKFARQWMAAQQALQPQPRTARDAEPLHRSIRIPRTGWLEPAASAGKHRQIRFVEAQRKQSALLCDGVGGRSFLANIQNCCESSFSRRWGIPFGMTS